MGKSSLLPENIGSSQRNYGSPFKPICITRVLKFSKSDNFSLKNDPETNNFATITRKLDFPESHERNTFLE
jgi:hypothetical protein